MEVLFKILYLLSISSATLSVQLIPSLKVKGPVGLDLSIGGINSNNQNNINLNSKKLFLPVKKCYCIPSNAHSRPVTSNFDASNGKIQRLVVYLYKINGAIKIYIPNKLKQALIPELNFDDNEGDVLKLVSSESIVDIFESHIFKTQETEVAVSEDIVKETESSDVGSNNVEQSSIISGSEELVIENTEYLPVGPSNGPSNAPINGPSNGNIVSVEENSIDGENVSIDTVSRPSNENQGTTTNNQDQSSQSITTSSQSVSTSSESISASQSQPKEIINQVTVIDGQDLNIIPNLVDSDQQQQISSISNILVSGDQDKTKKIMWDKITNSGGSNSLLQVITPENSQVFSDNLQQNSNNPDLTIKPYITFNDWFDLQLKRYVLYNLETESKILNFRNQILEILQNNGMSISIKGIVRDSNQKLVRMNNIKLRPILIGSQIDPQTLLEMSNGPDAGILYVQLIEVILVSPPKLLGTLIMGTVYLPRSIIKTPKVNIVAHNKKENIDGKGVCTSCGVNIPQYSFTRASYPMNGLRYLTVPKPYPTYAPYYPLRPKVMKNGLPYVERNGANVQAPKRINGVSQGRSGIFDSILGSLAPILFSPSRRVLGGRLPQGPPPGPRPYPNDVQPGYRIIGGNAATSSGTPLVNKGRSGFESPAYII